MDWFSSFFLLVAAIVVGPLLYRMLKYKSFSAAMSALRLTHRRPNRTAAFRSFEFGSSRVHALGPADRSIGRWVGLQVVSKAPLGASTMPIRLTVQQAQELSTLLQSALHA